MIRPRSIWVALGTFLVWGIVVQFNPSTSAQDVKIPAPPAGTNKPTSPNSQPMPLQLPETDEPLDAPPDDVKTDINPNDFLRSKDESIKIYEQKVKEHPKDYISRTVLGQLYLDKAAEGGDLILYAKAEASFRLALEDAPGRYKFSPKLALAGVLCDRHKFAESLELAQALLKESPKNKDVLMVAGDCRLELGHYEDAERAFKNLIELEKTPEALARLARLAELKGDVARCRKLLIEATEIAKKVYGTLDEHVTWFEWRLADLAFTQGQLDQASAQFEAILKNDPGHHDATYGLGRVLAAQGKLPEALALIRKAVEIGAEPHILSSYGDLLTKMGRLNEAEAAYQRVVKECGTQPEYRREYALFLCDHNRDLPKALELAQAEFAIRQDIQTRDVLAWALFKNGKIDDAVAQMKEATKMGAKDARMFFHAALMLDKLGFKERAREYLDMVMGTNPYFSILQGETAKTLHDQLPKRQD